MYRIVKRIKSTLVSWLIPHKAELPKSRVEALREARARIDASDTPLIHTWEELEAEIADRRGGVYRQEYYDTLRVEHEDN